MSNSAAAVRRGAPRIASVTVHTTAEWGGRSRTVLGLPGQGNVRPASPPALTRLYAYHRFRSSLTWAGRPSTVRKETTVRLPCRWVRQLEPGLAVQPPLRVTLKVCGALGFCSQGREYAVQ